MNAQPSLPAEPLLDALETIIGEHSGRRRRYQKAIDRGRRRGYLSVWQIDRMSVELLGRHPIEVYGADWIDNPTTEGAFP